MLYYERVADWERTTDKETALAWYEDGFVVEVWNVINRTWRFVETWE